MHHVATTTFDVIAADGEWRFLADNPAIVRGYRHRLTPRQALRSLLQVHNETLNVWSHALGAVTMVLLFIHVVTGGVQLRHPGSGVAAGHDRALAVSGGDSGVPITASSSAAAVFAQPNANASPSTGAAEPGPPVPPPAPSWQLVAEDVASELRQLPSHFTSGVRAAFAALRDGAGSGASSASSLVADGWAELEAGLAAAGADIEAAADDLSAGAVARLEGIEARLQAQTTAARQYVAGVTERLPAATAVIATAERGAARLAAARSRLAAQLRLQEIDDGHAAPRNCGGGSGSPASTGPARPVHQWPIGVFLASAFVCLTLSATFHLFHVLDAGWFSALAKADYLGIAVLICGSTVAPIVYGFHCMPVLGNVYLFLSFAACTACVGLGMLPSFMVPSWRLVRMTAFIATGSFGAVPLAHLCLTTQVQFPEVRGVVVNFVVMGALYLVGALLYGYRIPERFFPGKFDIAGASHQIFHVCVFAACMVHYYNVQDHYHWRAEHAYCEPGGERWLWS
jgi:adiponectin receptor